MNQEMLSGLMFNQGTRFDAELCIDVMQVKVLLLILVELCKRTAGLAHPLPVSQVGSNNIQVRLHYIDGNYTVLPEVVEASLGPHMQVIVYCNLPSIGIGVAICSKWSNFG